MPKTSLKLAVPVESRILILRRQRVILDTDLAELYGVTVKRLNQQVNRNQERFPADFMFQLTAKEDHTLRLQIATSKKGRGGRRYSPYAFTEHGAIMAATVLNSKRAIEMILAASWRLLTSISRIRTKARTTKTLRFPASGHQGLTPQDLAPREHPEKSATSVTHGEAREGHDFSHTSRTPGRARLSHTTLGPGSARL